MRGKVGVREGGRERGKREGCGIEKEKREKRKEEGERKRKSVRKIKTRREKRKKDLCLPYVYRHVCGDGGERQTAAPEG